MNKREKEKLVEYLYPTPEMEDFLINVLYQDLKEIVPRELCINCKNKNAKQREQNYNKVSLLIRDYLYQHEKYLDYLDNEYPLDMDEELFDDLVINFVFCLTQESEEYKNVDIFKNKKSICFTEISVLDLY